MQEPTTSADVHRVERLIVEVRIREYVEYVETKIKDMFDKKYGTAKLFKLVPGQTVNVKAPSDNGFKELVVRKDNSPFCY